MLTYKNQNLSAKVYVANKLKKCLPEREKEKRERGRNGIASFLALHFSRENVCVSECE